MGTRVSTEAAVLVPETSPTGFRLPALVVGAGGSAALRFVEFFTVTIRNKHTRTSYAHAAALFLRWREAQGISDLGRVQPVHVAAYIEVLQGGCTAPTVKQHLACIRMLFDWLVTRQVIDSKRRRPVTRRSLHLKVDCLRGANPCTIR